MASPSLNQSRMLQQARDRYNAGDYAGSARALQTLIRNRPRDPGLLSSLASVQIQQGKLAQARANLQKAIKLKQDPVYYRDLGRVLRHEGRTQEAREALERSNRLQPGVPGTIAALAELEYSAGEADRAMALLEPHIGAEPDPLITSALSLVARGGGDRARAIDVVRRELDAGRLTAQARSVTLFRLGSLLDAEGRYDEAFEVYKEANASRRARFDPDGFSADVDCLIEAWTPEAVAAAPRSRVAGSTPVFIIGMPRSGTSLLEQILSSHPLVAGGGEMGPMFEIGKALDPKPTWTCIPRDPSRITRPVADKHARRYLQWTRSVSKAAKRVTDKQVSNFLYVGLMWSIFAEAPVIHIRRNAIDCCLSSYFQAFADAVAYSFDLTHLGRVYRDYTRLMAHWREVLDMEMFEVEYEQLVADQEGRTRALIAHMGLEWNDACLRFHENRRVTPTASNDQVRRPMYKTSVERWRKYEKHVGPLVEALGDAAPAS